MQIQGLHRYRDGEGWRPFATNFTAIYEHRNQPLTTHANLSKFLSFLLFFVFPTEQTEYLIMNWLRTVRERRLFYLVVVLVTLLLFVWRFFLAETFSLANILDNIISASVISLVTLSFFSFVPREFPDLRFVVQIDPSRANELHMQALAGTSWWWHQGHYGRWTRQVAAPALEKKADSRIRWIILDPRNSGVCKKYVDFRNHHRLVLHNEWDLFKVRVELYSTIFAAYQYHHSRSPICINLYLANFFSTYRIDLSDKAIFITTVDARDPPFMLTQESGWYSILKNDFESVAGQSTALDLEPEGVEFSARVDEVYVRAVLAALGFPLADDDKIAGSVAQEWKKEYNRYV